MDDGERKAGDRAIAPEEHRLTRKELSALACCGGVLCRPDEETLCVKKVFMHKVQS